MVLLVLGVTKAALSFAWLPNGNPMQNQVSLYRLNVAAPKQNQRAKLCPRGGSFCYAQN